MIEYASFITKSVLWSLVSNDNNIGNTRILVWNTGCECDSNGFVFASPSGSGTLLGGVIQIDQNVSIWFTVEAEERGMCCLFVREG